MDHYWKSEEQKENFQTKVWYFSVHTKTQNESKRAETSRNSNSNFSTSFHFSNFEPKCRNLGILGKEVSIFQPFNEILPAPYFENADFKSGIGFQKFWAKIPKYGHYGSKNTNFLTLARFCLYDISEVLVSNLTFASCGS